MAKARSKDPEVVLLDAQELDQLLGQLKALLPEATYQLVETALHTLRWLTQQLESKNASIRRLKRVLFGSKSEKSRDIVGADSTKPEGNNEDSSTPKPNRGSASSSGRGGQPPGKGHGRRSADEYSGAKVQVISHPTLKAGSRCPRCLKGILRLLEQPARIVRITAHPLLEATVYELEQLRCNLCGGLFTAPAPAQAAEGKYDPNVGVMLAISRYAHGVPMKRTETWQAHCGVPMPAGTQWDLINEAARTPEVIYQSLIDHAAQHPLVHSDDTYMRVESLRKQIAALDNSKPTQRTGIFTTSIVSLGEEHQVALFITGRQHAGENLDDVLERRDAGLDPPLQMCDGLSRNDPKRSRTIPCSCIPHGRRKFVEIAEDFPEFCAKVLQTLGQVHHVEAHLKKRKRSAARRLALHRRISKPLMDQLHQWMRQHIDQHQVEPNSTLGKAINYMLKRWDRLTRFLSVPGAPLDNNISERALKFAIRHRKNSLGFKTLHGAHVADIFMSLIHTCQLNGVNPYAYLMALQKYSALVRQDPARWLPWNYHQALEALESRH